MNPEGYTSAKGGATRRLATELYDKSEVCVPRFNFPGEAPWKCEK